MPGSVACHDRNMKAVNLDVMLARFAEHWSPKKIAQVNHYDVRIVTIQGEFTSHRHADTDEFFLVRPPGQSDHRPEPPSGFRPGAPGTAPALRRPHAGGRRRGPAPLLRRRPRDRPIALVVLTVAGGAGIPLYLAGLLLIAGRAARCPSPAPSSSPFSPAHGNWQGRHHAYPNTASPGHAASSPMSRGSCSGQHLRVSGAESQAVTGRLSLHFGDGRLDQAGSGERAGRAMSATTRVGLSGLSGDLPDTGAPARPGQPPRRNRHPVLFIALVAVPLLWLAFGVVAAVIATRVLGYSRSGQHR